MKPDIVIAQEARIRPIVEIADMLGIPHDELEMYGKFKAKVPLHFIDEERVKKAKLILVTAITPTPAGEGKTTTSIGLAQALNRIGKKTTVILREPSLGPVFGIKGGAAGGGYSQVIPMEDINLHFTGDISAIEKAHNLLAALIDNNIQLKNGDGNLSIDPRTIEWKRVMDMNERSLRDIVIGLGGTTEGVPRQSGFEITAASEVMATLCMAKDLKEVKEQLILPIKSLTKFPTAQTVINHFTASNGLSKRKSRPSARKCMVPTMWNILLKLRISLTGLTGSVLATWQYVSQKHRNLCLMIRIKEVALRDLQLK